MRALALLPFLLAAGCGGTPVPAPVPTPETRAAAGPTAGRFLLLRGGAPDMTEDFQRHATGFTASAQWAEFPGGFSYQASTAPDATIDSLMIQMTRWEDLQSYSLTLRPSGDSALIRLVQLGGDSPQERTIGTTAGAMFYIVPSVLMLEQIVRRARVIGGDSVAVPIFLPFVDGGRTATWTVTFPSADSAVVMLRGTPQTSTRALEQRIHVDAEGRLLGAAIPGLQVIIEQEAAAH